MLDKVLRFEYIIIKNNLLGFGLYFSNTHSTGKVVYKTNNSSTLFMA
jgi:hypothetical protein